MYSAMAINQEVDDSDETLLNKYIVIDCYNFSRKAGLEDILFVFLCFTKNVLMENFYY